MRTMYDDSTPPQHPPGTMAVAFYIGGDTPHVWTDTEINRQTAQYRLPIWVRSNPSNAAQGTLEGGQAASWALAHKQPKGTCIALDFEMAIHAEYVKAFDAAVTGRGYQTLLYGSRSFVLQNPKPSGGYWVAQWDGNPTLQPGWAAKQYASDTMLNASWDLSVVADSTPLWNTQETDVNLSDALPTQFRGDDGQMHDYWAMGVMNRPINDPPSVAYALLNACASPFLVQNQVIPMIKTLQDVANSALQAVQALAKDGSVDVAPIMQAIEDKVAALNLHLQVTASEPTP